MSRGTGYLVNTDIYELDHVTRNTGVKHARALLVDILRENFARDREFHYVDDIYGFPKTPSHLGLEPNAGIEDRATTRVFIGSPFRYENAYLPSIIVKQNSSQYKPISFNQNKYSVEYEIQRVEDGYGNVSFINMPSKYVYNGAWDQSFEIRITSNSMEDTASLADIVMISLQSTYREVLRRNGVFIKTLRSSGEQSRQAGENDPFYTVSVSADVYTEWKREIPIANMVDRVTLCFSIDLGSKEDVPASGLAINEVLELS